MARLAADVILAAGDFPRRGTLAREILESARRVICCDGAADACRRRLGREPYAVVGDGDSVRGRYARQVTVEEQETNDLAKAVSWCRARRIARPVILGACGRREDHTIANVFRALDFGLEIVTDRGAFTPVAGRARLAVRPGDAISVFAPDRETRMTSIGLRWPLDGVVFANLYCASLNRATSSVVTLTATRPVTVWRELRRRGRNA